MPITDLSFLFDENPSPMWVYELSSLNILKVNKAAVNRYGFSEQAFLNMKLHDLHSPDVQEKHQAGADEIKSNSNVSYSGIWRHRNSGGEDIFADIVSHAIHYQQKDCRIVLATDVSERVRYQEQVALREQELIWTKNSLEALINNTDDQIWSVDKNLRYVYMNAAYRKNIFKLTGVEPAEGDEANKHSYYKQDTTFWDTYYSRALNGENYTVINERVDIARQRISSFEISFNPIYKSEGEITGVGCFARDITERLKTENELVIQNERLRHIASLTSHELRRPVASMLGLINIMDRANFFNPDNKEIIEHLLTVGNEIDEVIRLIIDKTITDTNYNEQ